MVDYLIQDNTITAMANHMRRISGTTDTLNGAEIAELFSRTQGTIKTDGEYLVEAINYDGTVIKSGNYDTGEVFAFPKDVYSNELLEFDGWVATSPITNNYCVVDDMPIEVGAIMKPSDDCMIICLDTVEANTEVKINFHLKNDDIIDWGDSIVDTIANQLGSITEHSHIYTNIGSYIIKIYSSQGNNITNRLGEDSITKSLIKHVYIPSYVNYIYGPVFEDMTNLECVVFADGLYFEQCDYIFNNCTSLEYVVFPDNIKTNNKFSVLNSGVKKVILPYGITTLPYGCFGDCVNLSDIIIPNSVTTIGENAFARAGLTKFIVPDSITSIGDYAFSRSNIKELVISKNVTSLGKYIIMYCKNLEKITIEEGITTIGDYTFSNWQNLNQPIFESITLPSTVTSIGKYAFQHLRYLYTIVLLSNSVCSLGDYALSGTKIEESLTSSYTAYIYVPDSLVDSYKTATNWSKYASKIKPLSSYTVN